MYAGVVVNGLVSAWALVWGRRRYGAPGGLLLGGVGFLLAVAGAALDEWWHANVGKDVNLWSPPHLVGLAGAALIAVGLVLAVAAHTRFAETPRRRLPRVILLLGFADLVHKAMVALDHYTLDAWGRTPDFYPFLLALFLPAIFMAATRALGPGAAAATAAIFTAEHVLILLALLAFGMRVPTFTPIPLLPPLAIELAVAALPVPSTAGLAALFAGALFALVMYAQEAAWMAWAVGRPWELGRVALAFPGVLLTAVGSAWLGRVVGTVGIAAAYRPSRAEPPSTVAALGLAPDTSFDHRDAVFWEALLPDGWRAPGTHHTYQEAIVDGRGIPLGPAWCARDGAGLARELAGTRFTLSINGEPVDLARYPRARRRTRDGSICEWVGVAATTPRPGLQELSYTLERDSLPPSAIIVRLRVKEP